MRLQIATPLMVVLDADGVVSVRAEDETGAFGILPGHADFITALAISVVSWRDERGRRGEVAVRGGVLTVKDGDLVGIATRQAVGEETLKRLGDAVLARFREEAEAEASAHVAAGRMELAALRGLQQYLDAGSGARRQRPGAQAQQIRQDGGGGDGGD